MSKLGFHRFEGLLGTGEYTPKILFLFCEPNAEHLSEQASFWFKDVLEGREKGTRYRNVLTILAYRILRPMADEFEDYNILNQCAYMNLRPDGGKSKISKEFGMVLDAFGELSPANYETVLNIDTIDWNVKDTPRKIAEDRMNIINRVIESGVAYIVTTEKIYEVMKRIWKRKNQKEYKLNYTKRGKHIYHYCEIGQTKLISFAHPSRRDINHTELKNMIIWTER